MGILIMGEGLGKGWWMGLENSLWDDCGDGFIFFFCLDVFFVLSIFWNFSCCCLVLKIVFLIKNF